MMLKRKNLYGKFCGERFQLRVTCYPNNPSIRVVLAAQSGKTISISQNLGGAMPQYQCILSDAIFGPADGGLMHYLERNKLGYLIDYKVTGARKKIAGVYAVFQFDPKQLRHFDAKGCRAYESKEKSLRRKFLQPSLRRAG